MKLAICTKFQVNRMNCVESRRRGGDPIDPPPSRLRVTIFSRRLLGLMRSPMIYRSTCVTFQRARGNGRKSLCRVKRKTVKTKKITDKIIIELSYQKYYNSVNILRISFLPVPSASANYQLFATDKSQYLPNFVQ